MVQFRKRKVRVKPQFKTSFQKKGLVLSKREKYLKIDINKYGSLFSFLYTLKTSRGENNKFLGFSNGMELKTISYRLLKDIKTFKSGSNSLESISFLQQTSKLFSSKVEKKKKIKKVCFRKKGLMFLKKTFRPFIFFNNQLSFKSPKNFKIFWLLKRKQSEFLKILKNRSVRFKFKKPLGSSRPVLERRLLLHKIKTAGKKNYKKLHGFLFLRKKALRSLLKYYALGLRKYKYILKQKKCKLKRRNFRKRFRNHIKSLKKRSTKVGRFLKSSIVVKKIRRLKFRKLRRKKIMRRLIKKWNRKKKWKRRGVFRFFRSKLRFLNFFSVPRHFEINYKTGEILYLGFIDSSSVDLRLPFRLNVRRLTTHFSS